MVPCPRAGPASTCMPSRLLVPDPPPTPPRRPPRAEKRGEGGEGRLSNAGGGGLKEDWRRGGLEGGGWRGGGGWEEGLEGGGALHSQAVS